MPLYKDTKVVPYRPFGHIHPRASAMYLEADRLWTLAGSQVFGAPLTVNGSCTSQVTDPCGHIIVLGVATPHFPAAVRFPRSRQLCR